MIKEIANGINFVGIEDTTLDLFEGQYEVPNGISYNTTVIVDKKIAILDTVDSRVTDEWISIVKKLIGDRTPDYLVISHLEPDHSANIETILNFFPNVKIVGNAKTFMLLPNFVKQDIEDKKVVVDENSELDLGEHKLRFFMAPMIHWPEVMMEYDSTDKILFSADAFGRFGKFITDEDWVDEARRYYFNIVGKYGTMVQNILKKVAPVEVKKISPLHGPVLENNLSYFRNKYNIWSGYLPEDKGVTIAVASIHGNTKEFAKEIEKELLALGVKVGFYDLSRCSMSRAVESAFRYNKLILASSTYDGSIFTPMQDFLTRLKSKNFQNRSVALIENGTWAPVAARQMKEIVDGFKAIDYYDKVITIKSTVSKDNLDQIDALVNWSKE